MSTIPEYIAVCLMALMVVFMVFYSVINFVIVVEWGKVFRELGQRLAEQVPRIMALPRRMKIFLMTYLLLLAMVLLVEFLLMHKWMYEHHFLSF